MKHLVFLNSGINLILIKSHTILINYKNIGFSFFRLSFLDYKSLFYKKGLMVFSALYKLLLFCLKSNPKK